MQSPLWFESMRYHWQSAVYHTVHAEWIFPCRIEFHRILNRLCPPRFRYFYNIEMKIDKHLCITKMWQREQHFLLLLIAMRSGKNIFRWNNGTATKMYPIHLHRTLKWSPNFFDIFSTNHSGRYWWKIYKCSRKIQHFGFDHFVDSILFHLLLDAVVLAWILQKKQLSLFVLPVKT